MKKIEKGSFIAFFKKSANMFTLQHQLSTRTTTLLLILMTVIALFIRIEYVKNTVINRPIRADAREYVIYGYSFAKHGTYSREIPSPEPRPDSFRSPGYPLLIALSFVLGGNNGFYPITIYTQIVLSALLIPLTFFYRNSFSTVGRGNDRLCSGRFQPASDLDAKLYVNGNTVLFYSASGKLRFIALPCCYGITSVSGLYTPPLSNLI